MAEIALTEEETDWLSGMGGFYLLNRGGYYVITSLSISVERISIIRSLESKGIVTLSGASENIDVARLTDFGRPIVAAVVALL
jgi:hypothetical protein